MRLAVPHREGCPAVAGELERPWVLSSVVVPDDETHEPQIVAVCNDGLCEGRAYLAVGDLEAMVAGELGRQGIETGSSAAKRKAPAKS